MIRIQDKGDCCGCSACMNVCNHNAICMEPDAMGFLYPVVDEAKCIECGLCNKVCAFNNDYDTSDNLQEPICLGARHKDIKEVETSRSGAAFVAISDWVLKNHGVVYGAGYTEHFRVLHKRATTKDDCDEFKGSKYVQSDINTVFFQVKQDLNSGRIVLFSGTPCQTAGLKSYIGKKLSESLYLVDIICHGVPSPFIWRDYISYMEQQYKTTFEKVDFRRKEIIGWSDHKEALKVRGGKWIYKDLYTNLFYSSLLFRKSCEKCPYTNTKRPSDITLGDFWGWEKTNPEANLDDKGISLVICNTRKGLNLVDSIKNDLNYFHARLEDCIQSRLEYPTPFSKGRDLFESEYINEGFLFVFKKYCKSKPNIIKRIYNRLKGLWIEIRK